MEDVASGAHAVGGAGRVIASGAAGDYSDRWQRNLRRTLELLEDELHQLLEGSIVAGQEAGPPSLPAEKSFGACTSARKSRMIRFTRSGFSYCSR